MSFRHKLIELYNRERLNDEIVSEATKRMLAKTSFRKTDKWVIAIVIAAFVVMSYILLPQDITVSKVGLVFILAVLLTFTMLAFVFLGVILKPYITEVKLESDKVIIKTIDNTPPFSSARMDAITYPSLLLFIPCLCYYVLFSDVGIAIIPYIVGMLYLLSIKPKPKMENT